MFGTSFHTATALRYSHYGLWKVYGICLRAHGSAEGIEYSLYSTTFLVTFSGRFFSEMFIFRINWETEIAC